MHIDICSIIADKRDKKQLTKQQIEFFVNGAAKNIIPDYQLSALLMAIYLNGMTSEETAILTLKMAESGDMVDLSRYGALTADKHSTGGVGDKTTLIVAPIAASCGVIVAKMSGRGLGFTGGTIDKLESIPGYKTSLEPDVFRKQVEQSGIAVIGQSGDLAPADKRLYALRDVTETVASIPLIASSIMSKKLAAGSKNIVLDVKVGNGAFMKTEQQARQLANAMIDIGKRCGRNVSAVLTSMDSPLGTAVGNSLEVAEAAEILKTAKQGDITEVSLVLAAQMISLALKIDEKSAYKNAKHALESGAAFDKLCELATLQGGDDSVLKDPSIFPKAKNVFQVKSAENGYVKSINAEKIGYLSVILGAGREKKDDIVDFAAGIEIIAKPGDKIKKGDTLSVIHTNKDGITDDLTNECLSAYTFCNNTPDLSPVIIDIIR